MLNPYGHTWMKRCPGGQARNELPHWGTITEQVWREIEPSDAQYPIVVATRITRPQMGEIP
jgi:hypothetical protein